jgi:hypothetical protein
MSETRTAKFPAFRVHRNAIVRINRRRWRVQSVELVAVYRKGERQEPRLRFRLSDGAGHHMNVTKEQFDLMTLEVRS